MSQKKLRMVRPLLTEIRMTQLKKVGILLTSTMKVLRMTSHLLSITMSMTMAMTRKKMN